MSTVIRPMRSGEELEVARLLDEAFGAVPFETRRRLWDWRNQENPAQNSLDLPSFLVAEAAGEIVGVHGLFPLRLKVGRQIVPVSCACDFAVSPSARTAGLKLKLEAARCGQVQAHLSTSANEAASRLTVALGGVEVPEANTTYVKPLRFAAVASRHASRLGRGLPGGRTLGLVGSVAGGIMDSAGGTLRRLRGIPNPLRGCVVSRVRSFGPEHQELTHEAAAEAHAHILRDSQYLNWRYLQYPFSGIEALEARAGGELVAVGVSHSHLDSAGNKVGSILELLYRPDASEIALGLLSLMEDHLRECGAVVCLLRTGSVNLREALKVRGFRAREGGRSPYTYRLGSQDLALLSGGSASWYLSLGDGDAAFHWPSIE